MLTFSYCLKTIHQHLTTQHWSRQKDLTQAICEVLLPENSWHEFSESSLHKLYRGTNKGRELYQMLASKNVTLYLSQAVQRLNNKNAHDCRFSRQAVADILYQKLQKEPTFSGTVQQGLRQSYLKHYHTNAHVFIVEVLFYSLDNVFNTHTFYVSCDVMEGDASNSVLDMLIQQYGIQPSHYSKRFLSTIDHLTPEELALFEKLAQFVLWDEDDVYFLYAPEPHSDGWDLYYLHGLSYEDVRILNDAQLINCGLKHRNTMLLDGGEPYGLQNHEYVITFQSTTEENVEIYHGSFPFTEAGLTLLDIIDFETSNSFILALGEHLRKAFEDMGVEVGIMEIDDCWQL